MAESFIERRIELGESSEVLIRFHRPVQDGADFRCDYEILWPGRKHAFHAFGIDGVQALFLAMKMVHSKLLASPAGKRGQLRWLGSNDLGLPALDV